MKGKKALIGTVAAAVILGWGLYENRPTAVVECDGESVIRCVADWRLGDVTERIDGKRLFGVLEQFRQKGSGFSRAPERTGLIQVEISGRDRRGEFVILLGGQPVYFRPEESRVYRMIQDDVLLREILEMIDGEAEGGGKSGEEKENLD